MPLELLGARQFAVGLRGQVARPLQHGFRLVVPDEDRVGDVQQPVLDLVQVLAELPVGRGQRFLGPE
ncbi:hypothetical protein ACWKWC_04310 [Geodermatophilus nigrescens]